MQTADREQMGEARAAHRLGIRVRDAELVAGCERRGDAPLPAIAERLADPRGEVLAPAGEARGKTLAFRRAGDRDVERTAGPADLLEPGGAREIIAARHRHRRGRHDPGAEADRRPGDETGGELVMVDIDAQP